MTGARLVQRKGRVDWGQTCATPVQRKGGLIAVKSRISGKEAVYVARESERRRPVKLLVSRSVHASMINAWHLRPIWRATRLRKAFGKFMSDEFVDSRNAALPVVVGSTATIHCCRTELSQPATLGCIRAAGRPGTPPGKGRPPRHSRQWGLGSRPQRNERWTWAWGGGSRKIFEINPEPLWTIVEHAFRPPDVVQEHPPAPHASARLSAAASDAACTAA
jgi:hypothetical protein